MNFPNIMLLVIMAIALTKHSVTAVICIVKKDYSRLKVTLFLMLLTILVGLFIFTTIWLLNKF
jgi:hypothetical protein